MSVSVSRAELYREGGAVVSKRLSIGISGRGENAGHPALSLFPAWFAKR
jgi:hypothetical protein